jgi:hypothetical protein
MAVDAPRTSVGCFRVTLFCARFARVRGRTWSAVCSGASEREAERDPSEGSSNPIERIRSFTSLTFFASWMASSDEYSWSMPKQNCFSWCCHQLSVPLCCWSTT